MAERRLRAGAQAIRGWGGTGRKEKEKRQERLAAARGI